MSVETEMYAPQIQTDFDADTFHALPNIPKANPRQKRRYSHDVNSQASYGLPTAPICRYFNLNRCFAGPNCRFTHIVNHGGYIIMYPTLATTNLMTPPPAFNPMSPTGMSPIMQMPPPMYGFENNSNPDENSGEVLKDENGKELCRYYRQGKCFMGAKCRFAHF